MPLISYHWMIYLAVGLFGMGLHALLAGDSLQIRQKDGTAELFVAQDPVPPLAGTSVRLWVDRSEDLRTWSGREELQPSDDPAAPRKLTLGGANASFFRLHREVEDVEGPAGGAELFGYNRVFAQNLRNIGEICPEEFVQRYGSTAEYLPTISFDPREARFWSDFNQNPAVYNAALPSNSPDRRLTDFRLDPAELGAFLTNGFVVSERLGSYSFADVFYRIFTDDLPVFISADSALHAWHFTYQALLGELEELYLIPQLKTVLSSMASGIPSLAAGVGTGPLRESVQDADYFLTVGQSLLQGQTVPSALGQDSRVAQTLAKITQGQYEPQFALWGPTRSFDFSQLRVRGHYTRTLALQRYFQAYMWTSLADLRVAGRESTPRELGTAIVLHELAGRSSSLSLWRSMDNLLKQFVGRVDSLTFSELGPLRTASGLTFAAFNQPGALEKLQADLLSGDIGASSYATAAYAAPLGPQQLQLPRIFSLTGRRFVADGWATAQVTFDRIRWSSPLPDGATFGGKVVRRLPTALDVLYGVLNNAQAAPWIAAGIQADGLPYQHNLAAVKATLDSQAPGAWEENIYTRWLSALRTLSAPTTDPQFPQALRTRAWAHKTFNTQAASWTQLRHDTVLYAAQPYSSIILCEYPAGYVEPRPEFWDSLSRLAQATADALELNPTAGVVRLPNPLSYDPGATITVNLATRHTARIGHCRNFAAVMTRLRDLSLKELAAQPFTDEDTLFIQSTMNAQDHVYLGKTFDGWYPTLFYKDYGQMIPGNTDPNASDRPDLIVTDVHTAPPDAVYPGGVLHEGVGNVDLMLIAVDCGGDRAVYAGPTMSHYEFTEPGVRRLSDSDWSSRLSTNKPARPPWTQDYLVPRR